MSTELRDRLAEKVMEIELARDTFKRLRGQELANSVSAFSYLTADAMLAARGTPEQVEQVDEVARVEVGQSALGRLQWFILRGEDVFVRGTHTRWEKWESGRWAGHDAREEAVALARNHNIPLASDPSPPQPDGARYFTAVALIYAYVRVDPDGSYTVVGRNGTDNTRYPIGGGAILAEAHNGFRHELTREQALARVNKPSPPQPVAPPTFPCVIEIDGERWEFNEDGVRAKANGLPTTWLSDHEALATLALRCGGKVVQA